MSTEELIVLQKSRAVKDWLWRVTCFWVPARRTTQWLPSIYKPGVQIQPYPMSPVKCRCSHNSCFPYCCTSPSKKDKRARNKSLNSHPCLAQWEYIRRATDVSESPQKIPHWDAYPGTKIEKGPCEGLCNGPHSRPLLHQRREKWMAMLLVKRSWNQEGLA